MTTWSSLFGAAPGTLPVPVPADLGKALMVRAGPAWTMDFIKADDVTGPWHVPQVINVGPTPYPAYDADSLLQLVSNTGHPVRIEMDAFGLGVSTAIFGKTSNGSAAAPTPTKTGDALLVIGAGGRGATAFTIARAQLSFQATLDWTDTSHPAQLAFSTTAQGSTAITIRWLITDDGTFRPNAAPLDIGTPAQPIKNLYGSSVNANDVSAGNHWVGNNATLTNSQPDAITLFLDVSGGSRFSYKISTGELWFFSKTNSNFWSGANGDFSIRRSLTVGGTSVYVGADYALQFYTDATSSVAYFDATASAQSYFQFIRAQKRLDWIAGGQVNFTSNPNGDFIVRGGVSVNAFYMPNNFVITSPTTGPVIQFEGNCYLQFTKPDHTLYYVVDSVVQLYIGKDGTMRGYGPWFAPSISIFDSIFSLSANSNVSNVNFNNTGSYLSFNRNAHQYDFYVEGAIRFTINNGGINSAGIVYAGYSQTTGYVALINGDNAHSGYIAFYQPGDVQAGWLGWTATADKMISFNVTAGYVYRFLTTMPLGPDGTNLAYARYQNKGYTVTSWVEVGSGNGIQIANPGCSNFVLTTGATQNLPVGFHCKVLNLSGGNLAISTDTGITLYWVNAAGVLQSGQRTMVHGGLAEVIYVSNSWFITGMGIS